MSSPEHKQLIWNIIKDIKFGMLVTHDFEGDTLHARPMSLVQEEYDGTLYFFTNKKEAKVYEVRNDHQICITFSDVSNQTYVSLSGKAHLTNDKKLVDRYWNPWVAAWFPEGKEDPDLTMLEVKIESGEHWNTNENKLIQLFKIVKANIMHETPNIGKNESFG